MFVKTAELSAMCGVTTKELPDHTLPEFAMMGRSNVGKSSLINALLNRKSLAHTSSEPGKTQTINYYEINNSFFLVDLPGYGYSRVSDEERRQWGLLIDRYLRQTNVLQKVFFLVDSRREPSENDREMFSYLTDLSFRPVIVATKTDKISRNECSKAERRIRDGLHLNDDDTLIFTSAAKKTGLEEISDIIEANLFF